MNIDIYNKIRKTWDINPETRIHGKRKKYQSVQRRQSRQTLNQFVGSVSNLSKEDMDEI